MVIIGHNGTPTNMKTVKSIPLIAELIPANDNTIKSTSPNERQPVRYGCFFIPSSRDLLPFLQSFQRQIVQVTNEKMQRGISIRKKVISEFADFPGAKAMIGVAVINANVVNVANSAPTKSIILLANQFIAISIRFLLNDKEFMR
jgi:hypothetical protein